MAQPAILVSKQEIDKRVGTADSFRWSIGLPVPVESQEAETVFEEGMPTITLPKSNRGDAGPRTLKPRAAVRTARK